MNYLIVSGMTTDFPALASMTVSSRCAVSTTSPVCSSIKVKVMANDDFPAKQSLVVSTMGKSSFALWWKSCVMCIDCPSTTIW